jgi:hypothetical protein
MMVRKAFCRPIDGSFGRNITFGKGKSEFTVSITLRTK